MHSQTTQRDKDYHLVKPQLAKLLNNNSRIILEISGEPLCDEAIKKLIEQFEKFDLSNLCLLSSNREIIKAFGKKCLIMPKSISIQANSILLDNASHSILNLNSEKVLNSNCLDSFLENCEVNKSIKESFGTKNKTQKSGNKKTISLILDNEMQSACLRLMLEICSLEKEENLHFEILQIGDSALELIQECKQYISIHFNKLQDIHKADSLKKITKLPIRDQAFLSKPSFLKYILKKHQDFILYSDLDIVFFDSPTKIADSFKNGTLLFPQYNDNFKINRQFGHYQAGLIGIKAGSENFLSNWETLCINHYSKNHREGYFTDQGFLDLAYVYDPNISIYREKNHNLAEWNKESFELNMVPEKGQNYGLDPTKDREIYSFHASINTNDTLKVTEKRIAKEAAIEFLVSGESFKKEDLKIFNYYSAKHFEDSKELALLIEKISTIIFIETNFKVEILKTLRKNSIILRISNLIAKQALKFFRGKRDNKNKNSYQTQKNILEQHNS